MKRSAIAALCAGAFCFASSAIAATDLVIATVNNGHMIEMQKLSKFFEQANPDIKLKWVTSGRGRLAPAHDHRYRHQGRPVRRDDHRPV